ncbi:hypothetical protein JXB11_01965, partial [Candidatus Woesearchaeota archaeon]|nr:hypothetical protein [Candidatus Woesearchaeota archaeon]
REAYDLLKERRVLKDRALTPVIRVALREINDFAKPLEVTIGESKQIFWKWYLLGKEETESLIKEALGLSKKVEAPAPPPQHPAPKEKIPEKIVPEKPAPIQQKIPEKPKEAIKPEPVQEKLAPAKPKPAAKPKKQPAKASTLLNDTLNFFEKSGIEVLEQGVLKKNSEFEFVIKMPTPVGEVKYYCVAKSKKRCSDSDLSAAFAQGDMRKLPVLFISPGELTKKAAALLEKGLNITYKKI